jgi:hypothetical protein
MYVIVVREKRVPTRERLIGIKPNLIAGTRMGYNIEMINRIAPQLAEMFIMVVIEQQKASQETPGIAQIETKLREALRQIGLQALGLFLNSMQTTLMSEIPYECGRILHYKRMRQVKIANVFGKTGYRRLYYAGCSCWRGKAPLDKQFGLNPEL